MPVWIEFRGAARGAGETPRRDSRSVSCSRHGRRRCAFRQTGMVNSGRRHRLSPRLVLGQEDAAAQFLAGRVEERIGRLQHGDVGLFAARAPTSVARESMARSPDSGVFIGPARSAPCGRRLAAASSFLTVSPPDRPRRSSNCATGRCSRHSSLEAMASACRLAFDHDP